MVSQLDSGRRLILFMTFASAFAFADSLSMVLISGRGGKFADAVSDPNGAFVMLTGVSLAGLSGVTGVTLVPASGSMPLGLCFSGVSSRHPR